MFNALWLIVIAFLWGGLTSLERRAFLQAMLSRPLVAATVTGLLVRDAQAGLYLGVFFELLYLGGVSLGGAQAEHETLPAVTATAMAAAMDDVGGHATAAMLALSVLLATPTGALGRWLEGRLDTRANKYASRVRQAVDAGDLRRAARQNLRALWAPFVAYGCIAAAGALLGFVVAPFEHQAPLPILRGLAWAWPTMGVTAAAIALNANRARRRMVIAALAGGVTFIATLVGQP